jgi:chorismate-pyruvate lyase
LGAFDTTLNELTARSIRRLLCTGGVLLFAFMVGADEFAPARVPLWPDTFAARVEATAVLQTLNAELLSHDSATLTLEHWCGVHRMASPPRIVAQRVPGVDKEPSLQQRRELGVSPTEPVRYRRVRLLCGAAALSEADNWYVPGRLTAAMNELLDSTDAPFGKVVQALHFQRRTLSSTLLWQPLPEGWEMRPQAAGRHVGEPPVSGSRANELRVPPQVLQHRAVLTLPDGTPFSEVVETYTRDILAFPAPEP